VLLEDGGEVLGESPARLVPSGGRRRCWASRLHPDRRLLSRCFC